MLHFMLYELLSPTPQIITFVHAHKVNFAIIMKWAIIMNCGFLWNWHCYSFSEYCQNRSIVQAHNIYMNNYWDIQTALLYSSTWLMLHAEIYINLIITIIITNKYVYLFIQPSTVQYYNTLNVSIKKGNR